MAYTKTTWVNDSQPAISAENLNNIENGISALDTAVGSTDISAIGDGTMTGAISALDGKIKFASISTDISSGIANLRTDGKPIIYVTSGLDGYYYSLGRSGQTIWVKVHYYDGSVISDRQGITFYYYYLDL